MDSSNKLLANQGLTRTSENKNNHLIERQFLDQSGNASWPSIAPVILCGFLGKRFTSWHTNHSSHFQQQPATLHIVYGHKIQNHQHTSGLTIRSTRTLPLRANVLDNRSDFLFSHYRAAVGSAG